MTLSFKTRFSYGVGHVLNDLCASMWFSYLLLFFHKVLKFSNSAAGYVILAGQIADGIATPLVGYESDRTGNLCNYGRRKTWHLIGTISVLLSFPPLFMRCIGCTENTPEYAQMVYYVPFVIIFQSGWAATQINHLALIPELARIRAEKVNLNAIRYAFTVLSNIMVCCITLIVFDISGEGTDRLGEEDITEFQNIVLVVAAVGLLFSTIFHIGVKENSIQQRFNIKETNRSNDNGTNINGQVANGHVPDEKTPLIGETRRKVCEETVNDDPCNSPMMRWSDWFKKPAFYQMALLYMCTRLVVNLSQVYIPMYLTDTLKLPKNFIALVPLTVYISGFIATILTKPVSTFLRNEFIYLIGSAFVIGACTWSHFLEAGTDETKRNIFFLAALLGFGTTIILVMCLSMLSELVGENTETGAFVYGAMSLTDKISNGVAIAVIQNLNPCTCNCPLCGDFFQTVLGWVISAIMVFAMIAVILYGINSRKNHERFEALTVAVEETEDSNSVASIN